MPRQFGGSAPKCPVCGKSVYAAEEVKGPGGNSWHLLCFCCKNCGKSMRGGEWKEIGGEPHCHACHAGKESVFGPRGNAAGRTTEFTEEEAGPTAPLELPTAPAEPAEPPAATDPQEDADEAESKPMSLKERMAALQASQAKDQALSKDATPTHAKDAKPKAGGRFSNAAPICPACNGKVYPAEEVKGPGGKSWHALCFCCKACGKSMRGGQWRDHAGEPHCQTCHGKLFGIKGVGFGNTLIDPGAKGTPEDSMPEASANVTEETKPMSLKERAVAFQGAADASASTSISFQLEKQSDDAKEEAENSGDAVQTSEDKTAAEAENKTDVAQTPEVTQDKTVAEAENHTDVVQAPEAQPCVEHTTGETVDHEIAKDETGAEAGSAPNEEAKIDLPSSKPMSLKERTRAFQAAADASASKSFSFRPENRSSDAKEEAAKSELQKKIAAEADNNGKAAPISEAQPCMKHTAESVDHEIAKDETKAGAGNASKEEAKTDLPSATCNMTEEAKTETGQVPPFAVTEQVKQEPATSTEEVAEHVATDKAGQVAVQAEVKIASSKVDAADAESKQQGEDQATLAISAPAEQSATPVSKTSHQSEPPQEEKTPESSTPTVATDQHVGPAVCKPCTNYRVDVTASNFGDCKCGFPKKAHEAQQQAAEESLEPVPSDSLQEEASAPEAEFLVAKPCSNYRLDVAGKSFGDCKCGFSKAAHEAQRQAAEESPEPVPSDSPQEEASAPEAEFLVAKPCSNYRLDVAGKSFGDCKCGFSKAAHEAQQEAEEPNPADVPSDSMLGETSAPEAEFLVAEPCSNYRLDVAGKSFGDCKCGFPKSAH